MQTLSRFFIGVLVLLSVVGNTAAEEYTTWGLPEGAKSRLGKGWISEITYSPDGTRLAVAGGIGIWLYDARTGEELDLLTGHTGGVLSVSFSPDGRTLASGSWDRTLRLWDVNTGEERHTLTGHTGSVWSVSFSPDGRTLASGSEDGTVILWDVNTGEQRRTLTGHTHYVSSVSFSPDGRTLASGSEDGTVILWDVNTGEQRRTLTGHTHYVSSVSFSPDGRTLASGSSDGTVILWDVNTGEERRTLTGHTDSVSSVSYSPDGRTLASGSSDGTVILWDVNTGEERRTLTGHTDSVSSVSYSPDGRTLASGSWDDTVILWDVNTGEERRTLTGHTGWVRSVSFSPDGLTLASGSRDRTLRLWDVNTGEERRTLTGHTDSVSSVSYSPDGRTLASGSSDGTVILWDVNTGEERRTLTGHTGWVYSVSFSPDGRTLASAGDWDFTIRLWDVDTGRHLRTLTGHTHWVSSVSFSPDGRTLASGSSDGTVILWDVNTGEERRTLTGHTGWVYSVSFSPDGLTLASGSDDNTVILWDVTTGEERRTLTGHTWYVNTVSFSPDGRTLASGSRDRTLRLWDVNTGEHRRTLTGHRYSVVSVSFSPDGRTLASGSGDGTVLLWELNPTTPTVTPGVALRVKGGTAEDYTDSQGRVWKGARQANQPWGGWIEKQPLSTTDTTLTPNAQAQAKAAGYDPELFHAVSWARHPDTLQYQLKTGNGTFDVTYLVSEHWFPNNRGFDILIEGTVVEPSYVTPGLHEIDIKTYKGIEVRDGTLDIQLKGNPQSGARNLNPMFSALEVLPSGTEPTTGNSEMIAEDPTADANQPVAPTADVNAIGLEVPEELLISNVAFGPKNATYFVLNAMYPKITGVEPDEVHYGDCTITLDFEDVPDNTLSEAQLPLLLKHLSQVEAGETILERAKGFAEEVGVLDGFSKEPQYFIFPLQRQTAKDRTIEILKEARDETIVSSTSALVGMIPLEELEVLKDLKDLKDLIDLAGIRYNTVVAINSILISMMDPVVRLTSVEASRQIRFPGIRTTAGRPNDIESYVLIRRKRVEQIKVKIEQAYMLEDGKEERHTVTYEGTYNLAANEFAAPSRQLTTLSDYPPFQLLPAEVQTFLLHYFSHPIGAVSGSIPERTVLLPNYPNPFNPETWLPYALAQPADVSISIYSADGRLVRRLDLGYQSAGMYVSRGRAVYWDGTNDVGESVASGVYFYTLTAGDFSATRKLLIRK